MSLILCTREDLSETLVSVDSNHVDELEAQDMVKATLAFFKSYLDTRPYKDFGLMSVRAENILRCNKATTIGDVKRLYVQAISNQGVARAGKMVRDEWATIVRASI